MITKVLVVDDSLAHRNNLESILKKAGYQVCIAIDGTEVLESVQNYNPDLILMDINMPGKDGFAATRELKAHENTKEIPVVFVTSKNQKADKAWGQMLGAKGYITKPYTETEVLDIVKAM